jgi:hypothetical protein
MKTWFISRRLSRFRPYRAEAAPTRGDKVAEAFCGDSKHVYIIEVQPSCHRTR